MKYLFSVPLAAVSAYGLYLYDARRLQIMYPIMAAIIFISFYTRLMELILKKPMWGAGWFGAIRMSKTIPVEKTGTRIATVLINLLVIPLVCYGYLMYDPKSDEPKQKPSDEMEEMYDSMH